MHGRPILVAKTSLQEAQLCTREGTASEISSSCDAVQVAPDISSLHKDIAESVLFNPSTGSPRTLGPETYVEL